MGGKRTLAAARHCEGENQRDLQRRYQTDGCYRSKSADPDAAISD